MFHIIQLVLVYQLKRDDASRSRCKPRNFRCSRAMPPWPCTMPLGRPVVPLEYSTHNGWSNGTEVIVSGSPPLVSVAKS